MHDSPVENIKRNAVSCLLCFKNSKVLVQNSIIIDLKLYRNMEMTRERISFTFDPRDMLLSLQMGFSFVRAVVACAILERTSGLEPSYETAAPRYLKLDQLLSFYLYLSLDAIGTVCHQFGLL